MRQYYKYWFWLGHLGIIGMFLFSVRLLFVFNFEVESLLPVVLGFTGLVFGLISDYLLPFWMFGMAAVYIALLYWGNRKKSWKLGLAYSLLVWANIVMGVINFLKVFHPG